MFRNKFKFPMTQDEINICIKGLLTLRNELLAEGKYTDAVDDLILRLAK